MLHTCTWFRLTGTDESPGPRLPVPPRPRPIPGGTFATRLLDGGAEPEPEVGVAGAEWAWPWADCKLFNADDSCPRLSLI